MSERNELLTLYINKPVADLCCSLLFTIKTQVTEFESEILFRDEILP
jgi:hypothetical protein